MTSSDRAALADELEKAADAYLNSIGDPMLQAINKNVLMQLLWDDKGTIIAALRSPSPYSGADFTDQLHARAECIRATNFVHIGEQDARDFADLFDKAASAIKDLTAQLGSYKKREDDRDDDLL